MLSIPKYPEQYAQHFPAIFYLLCCASQHHAPGDDATAHRTWDHGRRSSSSSSNQGLYVKPQPPAFIRTLFCGTLPHHHRIRRLQSELDYPPPYRGPLFQIFATKGSM